MSNSLLCKALYSNKVHIKDDDIVIDELFQIIGVEINTANCIIINTFTPLNYINTDEIQSHNSSEGKHFYIRKNENIRFMLHVNKRINIYEKHDNLRIAIYIEQGKQKCQKKS